MNVVACKCPQIHKGAGPICNNVTAALFRWGRAVLIFSQAGSRVKALEVKVATLIDERDAAKQNVRDAIHAMKAALEELRLKIKGSFLTLFAEDSSRHTGLSEVCKQGVFRISLHLSRL